MKWQEEAGSSWELLAAQHLKSNQEGEARVPTLGAKMVVDMETIPATDMESPDITEDTVPREVRGWVVQTIEESLQKGG